MPQRGPARDRLMQQREATESALADLRVEKAKVDGERKAAEADLGPVRYLATLIGSTDEQTMRWFILVVALLLGPAAVLLLLAATDRRNLTIESDSRGGQPRRFGPVRRMSALPS